MDFTLRCNSLKCRTPLTGQAVVTTCSHIFCDGCAHMLGLDAANEINRACPACQSSLPNTNDAVKTDLNPPEDYKTCILGGFSPAVIMECASRGLAFWSYQSTQEIVYQEHLAKGLTDKYNGAKLEVDQLINEANSQIDMLAQKLQDVTIENERLKTETQGLAVTLKERTRKHQQTQELYDRLKRKQMHAATQMAAQSAIDDSFEDIHWNPMSNRNRNSNGSDQDESRGSRLPRQEPAFGQGIGGNMPNNVRQHAQPAPTPRRSRLGPPNISGPSRLHNVTNGINGLAQATPRHRQPLNRISPNMSRLDGFGISAGVKRGNQNGPVNVTENQELFANGSLRRSPRLHNFSGQVQESNASFY